MSNHRALTDQQFDTHLGTLTEASLDDKITAWTTLQTDLDGEKVELEGHRGQVFKHKGKVSVMLEDLTTLKSFEDAGGGAVTQSQLDAVQASSVVISTANANDTGFTLAASTTLFCLKHSNKTGCYAELPLVPVDGRFYTVKNGQENTSPDSNAFIEVRVHPQHEIGNPAFVVGEQRTIDFRFNRMKLDCSSASGTTIEDNQNQCFRACYNAAHKAYISISDAF